MTNEVLKKVNIKVEFMLVDYKIKSNVNHNFFCLLKQHSINNILQKDISPKYKKKSKDFNREALNKIYNYSNYSNSLKDFFNINYLELFSKYYHNNEKPLSKFVFKGIKIELNKAKSFYYLLNKNERNAKDLKNIAKRFFIDNNSKNDMILFQTKKIIDLKE